MHTRILLQQIEDLIASHERKLAKLGLPTGMEKQITPPASKKSAPNKAAAKATAKKASAKKLVTKKASSKAAAKKATAKKPVAKKAVKKPAKKAPKASRKPKPTRRRAKT
jgi:hypothetical protein